MYKKYMLIILIISFFGCTQSVKNNNQGSTSFSKHNQPEDMYIDSDIKSSVDSMYVYYSHAVNALNFGDSIGSRIYYEKIFSIISEFDEETKSVLMDWDEYNKLVVKINSDYEEIFAQDIFDQEAEEIREELTAYEEEVFGDSSGTNIESTEPETNPDLIPLQINQKVELALKYFQTKGRKVFTIWLERSGRYENMIKSVLKQYELPENLVYLSMIESGFNPKAFSYARASGLWQFIYSTGKYYGLRSNWWFDERRDPILSTHAAARHLRDLNHRFGDWYLAMAGYNCNPKKIENRMKQYNTRDFWKLKRLPRQTRNYIPTFIAANLIAQNPEKYGFHIKKLESIEYDTVIISESVDLQVVADCVDATFLAIKQLNPAVKRWCTPPGIKNFSLNIPVGKKEQFRTKYAQVPDSKKISWVRHRVRSGETLSVIAKRYGTTVNVIKGYNKVRGTMIYTGDYLIIPVPQNKDYYKYQPTYARKTTTKKSRTKTLPPKGYKKTTYVVKKGDTLGEIAEIYHTRASKIRSWNGLYYGQNIYPKQKLALWVPENITVNNRVRLAEKQNDLPAGSYHIVRSGDTLWDIAQKYDISIKNLKNINNRRGNKIKPGEKLIIKTSSGG